MANGDRLLDTNIVVAFFNNDPLIAERLAKVGETFLSSTVLGELYYGVYSSQRLKANLTRLESFAARIATLPVSRTTSIRYGHVKSQLRAAGRPIPDNDIWIAASALEHGLTHVTRDEHFDAIEGLRRESW
jgi:tRNA(fMet)-specific endonuclease VapC